MVVEQGVVSTTDSIEAAATGVTMRSPGHGDFSKAVTLFQSGHKVTESGHKVTEVIPKRSQGHGGFSKAVVEVFEAITGHGNGRVTMVI